MADSQDQPTSVSVEAHERVKRENTQLKEQIAKLEPVVRDVALRDSAYNVFKGMEGVADPYGLASVAIRDVTLRDTPPDELGERLPQWFEAQRAAFGAPTPPPVAETDTEPASAAPAAPALAGGYNPAAPGSPPTSANDVIVAGSPEYNAILAGPGGFNEVKRLQMQGRIKWAPGNTNAQQLPTG